MKKKLFLGFTVVAIAVIITMAGCATMADIFASKNFPSDSYGKWERATQASNSSITLDISGSDIYASNQDFYWWILNKSDDIYEIINNTDRKTKKTIRLNIVGDNLEITDDFGSGANNWTGTWRKHYPSKVSGNFIYKIIGSDAAKTVTITGYTGAASTVQIPTVIEGIPVTAIAEDTFDKSVRLTNLTITASVIMIGDSIDDAEDAFDGATGLTNIIVDEANSVYSSMDGVLFNKAKTKLLLYPEGKSGSYTIPSSVTDIGNYAFEDCAKLTSVSIPESVTSIGEYAFADCTGLTSITIPESVTSIGNGAFQGCSGLKTANIPNSLTSISEYMFFNCTGLTSITIPDSVTSIGKCAFYLCTGLTSITIPGSVKTIEGGWDDKTTKAFGAFGSCTSLRMVTISDGVTSIGTGAFAGCQSLTSISIPNSVTYIGGLAFRECIRLTSVTVSPVDGRKWDYTVTGGYLLVFHGCPLDNASKTALRNAGYLLTPNQTEF